MTLTGQRGFSSQSYSSGLGGGRSLAQKSFSSFGGAASGGSTMSMRSRGGGGGFSFGGGSAGASSAGFRRAQSQSSRFGMSGGAGFVFCGGGVGGGGGGYGLGGGGSGFGLGGGGSGFGLGGGGGGFGLGGGGGGGGGGFGLGGGGGGFSLGGGGRGGPGNDKQQMQVLNDRLATYLDKVRLLEVTNRELEEKLRLFTANKVTTTHDLNVYDAELTPLREQLIFLIQEISDLALAIDNARLVADNFRIKYEKELVLRQTVDADVAGFRALKRDYEFSNTAMEQVYQNLLEERKTLKETHEEEMVSLRGEMVGTVTVDLKAAESVDLALVLTEIRSEYELVVQRNRNEAETWYTKQVEMKQAESALVTETTVTVSSEITESKKSIMTLQTDLESLMMTKASQDQRLLQVQSEYQVQMQSLSRLVWGLEAELSSVRSSAIQQSQDYQMLLSTKVQLEGVIATYRSLLEGAADLSGIKSGGGAGGAMIAVGDVLGGGAALLAGGAISGGAGISGGVGITGGAGISGGIGISGGVGISGKAAGRAVKGGGAGDAMMGGGTMMGGGGTMMSGDIMSADSVMMSGGGSGGAMISGGGAMMSGGGAGGAMMSGGGAMMSGGMSSGEMTLSSSLFSSSSTIPCHQKVAVTV